MSKIYSIRCLSTIRDCLDRLINELVCLPRIVGVEVVTHVRDNLNLDVRIACLSHALLRIVPPLDVHPVIVTIGKSNGQLETGNALDEGRVRVRAWREC